MDLEKHNILSGGSASEGRASGPFPSRHVTRFVRGFVDHPASVNETYFGHALFALRFAAVLFAAGCAALVHAVVPPLFESTASRLVGQLHERLSNRH